jgi:hypothetical protein
MGKSSNFILFPKYPHKIGIKRNYCKIDHGKVRKKSSQRLVFCAIGSFANWLIFLGDSSSKQSRRNRRAELQKLAPKAASASLMCNEGKLPFFGEASTSTSTVGWRRVVATGPTQDLIFGSAECTFMRTRICVDSREYHRTRARFSAPTCTRRALGSALAR